ncbi:hypothetical protein ACWDC2_29325, partial [Streptomyces olivaceus]
TPGDHGDRCDLRGEGGEGRYGAGVGAGAVAADVWDSRYTVTAYGMLMDRSCARAPHPTKTKEVLA